jgi:flagellin
MQLFDVRTASVSLTSLRQVERTSTTSSRQLSSGNRLPSASVDAAGVSIASRTTAQLAALQIGSRAALNAVSMLQTADGGLAAMAQSVQRMRELAVAAANGTLSDGDRAQLDAEYQAQLLQIDAVAKQTQFNAGELLDGRYAAALGGLSFQVGTGGTGGTSAITVAIGDFRTVTVSEGTVTDLGVTVPVNSTAGVADALTIQSAAVTAQQTTFTLDGTFLNGDQITVRISDDNDGDGFPETADVRTFSANTGNPTREARIDQVTKSIENQYPDQNARNVALLEPLGLSRVDSTATTVTFVGLSDLNRDLSEYDFDVSISTNGSGTFSEPVSTGPFFARQESKVALSGTFTPGDLVRVTVDSSSVDYLVQAGDDNAAIATALVAKLNGINGQLGLESITASGGDIFLEARDARTFSLSTEALSPQTSAFDIGGDYKVGDRVRVSIGNITETYTVTAADIGAASPLDAISASVRTALSRTFSAYSIDGSGTQVTVTGAPGESFAVTPTALGPAEGDLLVIQDTRIGLAAEATLAITAADSGLLMIAAQRAKLGGAMSALISASDSLATSARHAAKTRSVVADTDFAMTTTQLAVAQIIREGANAMLAQASFNSKLVLGLLSQ